MRNAIWTEADKWVFSQIKKKSAGKIVCDGIFTLLLREGPCLKLKIQTWGLKRNETTFEVAIFFPKQAHSVGIKNSCFLWCEPAVAVHNFFLLITSYSNVLVLLKTDILYYLSYACPLRGWIEWRVYSLNNKADVVCYLAVLARKIIPIFWWVYDHICGTIFFSKKFWPIFGRTYYRPM